MTRVMRWFGTAVILWCSLVTFGAVTGPATAQGGPPAGPGNPFDNLQAEIANLAGTATLVVDCGVGGTIASALAQPAHALVITVQGQCSANVMIGRDNVTLL